MIDDAEITQGRLFSEQSEGAPPPIAALSHMVRVGAAACLLAAATAGAQDESPDSDDSTVAIEEVIVTGTRLSNREFEGIAPVQVLNIDAMELAGMISAADIIRSTSLATGSFQANQQLGAVGPGGSVTNGGGGVNTISLRGLGTQRSLVLLDGRRVAPAGVGGSVSAVDLNVLPTAALQRVEIVKDGSSSIYGADAIAGVVNGITKKNYDGGSLSINANTPLDDGGERYFISGNWGKTFDRGWVSVAGEYSRKEALKNNQRDFLGCAEDYLFFPGTNDRADVLDQNGNFKCRNHNPNGAFFSADWYGGTFVPTDPNIDYADTAFNLAPDLPAADWAWTGQFFLDDTEAKRRSYSYRPESSVGYDTADAISPLETISLLINAAYELTSNTTAYSQFLFNRRESGFDSWYFLFQPMSGTHPNNTVSVGLQSASGGNSSGAIQYQLVRPYNSRQEVDYVNLVAGLRGDLPADAPVLGGWNWDAYLSYGRSDGEYSSTFMYEDRLNAISLGDTACDPSYLIPSLSPASLCDGTDIPVLSRRFLVDQAWTAEEQAFLLGREIGTTVYDQLSLEATIAGSPFEVPAGDVETVLGFSVRHEEIDDIPGPNARASNYHLFSSAGRTTGDDTVTEVFGEIGIPLLGDLPLVDNLVAVASARYTEYDISGGLGTYKFGLNWSIVPQLALRANIGSSFRGADLYELYLEGQTSFDFIGDPCQEWANSTNSVVRENCASLGIPDDYRPNVFDAEVVSGGNAQSLESETADAYSIGLIFTPGFADLSVALEYFDIEVNDTIDSFGTQNIIDGCYGSPNFPDEDFCGLLTRNPADAIADPFLITGVENVFVNIFSQTNRGVDLLVLYNAQFPWFDFGFRAQATRQIEDEIVRLDNVEDQLDFLNEPDYSGSVDLYFRRNDWNLYYGIDVIGSSGISDFYGGDTFQFFGPYNGETLQEVLDTGTVIYHDISIGRSFDNGVNVQLGIQNVFDETPPTVSVDAKFDGLRTGVAAQNSWDLRGRRLFLTLRMNY